MSDTAKYQGNNEKYRKYLERTGKYKKDVEAFEKKASEDLLSAKDEEADDEEPDKERFKDLLATFNWFTAAAIVSVIFLCFALHAYEHRETVEASRTNESISASARYFDLPVVDRLEIVKKDLVRRKNGEEFSGKAAAEKTAANWSDRQLLDEIAELREILSETEKIETEKTLVPGRVFDKTPAETKRALGVVSEELENRKADAEAESLGNMSRTELERYEAELKKRAAELEEFMRKMEPATSSDKERR